MSVTPTRNPSATWGRPMALLDPPISDTHGNEVTERIDQIAYTAKTPLPEEERDAFDLSLQLPDAAGETLCSRRPDLRGRGDRLDRDTPAGQSEDELEHPAPAFEILPAGDGATGQRPATWSRRRPPARTSPPPPTRGRSPTPSDGSVS